MHFVFSFNPLPKSTIHVQQMYAEKYDADSGAEPVPHLAGAGCVLQLTSAVASNGDNSVIASAASDKFYRERAIVFFPHKYILMKSTSHPHAIQLCRQKIKGMALEMQGSKKKRKNLIGCVSKGLTLVKSHQLLGQLCPVTSPVTY